VCLSLWKVDDAATALLMQRFYAMAALLGQERPSDRPVIIHEKKRVRGKRSTRTAPIAPRLADVLREWLESKPEHPHLWSW
jgi:hypothetical protein